MSDKGGDYKPTEHDVRISHMVQGFFSNCFQGLRKDGQPDKRVGTGEFAHGKADPHEEGAKGGKTS